MSTPAVGAPEVAFLPDKALFRRRELPIKN